MAGEVGKVAVALTRFGTCGSSSKGVIVIAEVDVAGKSVALSRYQGEYGLPEEIVRITKAAIDFLVMESGTVDGTAGVPFFGIRRQDRASAAVVDLVKGQESTGSRPPLVQVTTAPGQCRHEQGLRGWLLQKDAEDPDFFL